MFDLAGLILKTTNLLFFRKFLEFSLWSLDKLNFYRKGNQFVQSKIFVSRITKNSAFFGFFCNFYSKSTSPKQR